MSRPFILSSAVIALSAFLFAVPPQAPAAAPVRSVPVAASASAIDTDDAALFGAMALVRTL